MLTLEKYWDGWTPEVVGASLMILMTSPDTADSVPVMFVEEK